MVSFSRGEEGEEGLWSCDPEEVSCWERGRETFDSKGGWLKNEWRELALHHNTPLPILSSDGHNSFLLPPMNLIYGSKDSSLQELYDEL